jgi:uncharacterized protein (TIGR00730 family)
MEICVFCSANDRLDPKYFSLTEEFGRWASEHGHTIVFGGTSSGLMECVAKAAHEAGSVTVGVVPSKVEAGGHVSDHIDVYIPCDDLSDRKQLMMARSDAFVALPGGIGTLDEIFSVAASAAIGYHSKPLVLYSMDGFWAPLASLLDSLADKGVIRGQWRQHIAIVSSLDEVAKVLGEKQSRPRFPTGGSCDSR